MNKRNGIKYFRQKTPYSCGPACLCMILSSFGKEVSEAELTILCRTTRFGTTGDQIREAAISLDFFADTFKDLPRKEMLEFAKSKVPLIALLDASELYGGVPVGHFVVIIEIGKNNISYHDPFVGENLIVSKNKFIKAWQKFKFRGVKIWKGKKYTIE